MQFLRLNYFTNLDDHSPICCSVFFSFVSMVIYILQSILKRGELERWSHEQCYSGICMLREESWNDGTLMKLELVTEGCRERKGAWL